MERSAFTTDNYPNYAKRVIHAARHHTRKEIHTKLARTLTSISLRVFVLSNTCFAHVPLFKWRREIVRKDNERSRFDTYVRFFRCCTGVGLRLRLRTGRTLLRAVHLVLVVGTRVHFADERQPQQVLLDRSVRTSRIFLTVVPLAYRVQSDVTETCMTSICKHTGCQGKVVCNTAHAFEETL